VKNQTHPLECDQCGSFPERADILDMDGLSKPGDMCPAGHLDDYDCDGTLVLREGFCPVCMRPVPASRMTAHHLKTRSKYKGDPQLTELMCRECHSYIHRLFTNKELQVDEALGTVEGLLAHPEYAKAVAWIKTQDPTKHPKIRTSNEKKRKRGRRRA
jgi:hypothetical protein